jgi:hypothetical protein
VVGSPEAVTTATKLLDACADLLRTAVPMAAVTVGALVLNTITSAVAIRRDCVLELQSHGVAIRDQTEVAELHGSDGELEAVTLRDSARLSLSSLFILLGAVPCTAWLRDVIARDDDGFRHACTICIAGDQKMSEHRQASPYRVVNSRGG